LTRRQDQKSGDVVLGGWERKKILERWDRGKFLGHLKKFAQDGAEKKILTQFNPEIG